MNKPARHNSWHAHADTSAERQIAAALEPLDRVAREFEAQWGIGRLERLVSPATAAKFASARDKLDAAIQSGDSDQVVTRADIMIRGWKALDKEARETGNKPGDVGRFWATRADDGTKFVFVQHETDTGNAAEWFPGHRVWSMPEVIRVLASADLAGVHRAKELFPGATVQAVNVKTDGPVREDELPF